MRWITDQDLDTPSSPYANEAIESASYILWQLSGRKFSGVKTISEIYRQNPIPLDKMYAYSVPGSGMINTRCRKCGHVHTLWLRNRPVHNIVRFETNNKELDPSEYILLDNNRLVPTSPYMCWGGSLQDFVVTYTYGIEVPAPGILAARELANQILYSATNDDRCRLPDRVTSINRQGVSWTIIDPQDFLDKGRTGMYLVDLFLKTVNPTGSRARPRVFSPDTPTAGRLSRTRTQTSGDSVTIAATKGSPFTYVVGLPESTHIVVQVSAHNKESWEIPRRMISRNTETDDWEIVGTLASDTSLVPDKATMDVYEISESGALTHVSTGTIVRTAQTAVT